MTIWRGKQPLILASQSEARKSLLATAGLDFEVMPADIDERAIQTKSGLTEPDDIALVLAREKALLVSSRAPGRFVVGADQTLALDDRLFSKPADRAQAAEQLLALAGNVHELHSAVAVARDGKVLFADVATARMHMRGLGAGEIDAYLDQAGTVVTTSVGAYQLEGLGVHLFERIEGDHFTILGLPLLLLFEFLRGEGLLVMEKRAVAMKVLGLTGSIGMGKSTTAKLFVEAGIPVYDADATVHRVYEGEAVPVIEAAFPGTTANGKVDRAKLSNRVVRDPAAIRQLEQIVHPMLRAYHQKFLDDAEASGAPVAVVDVPLLFETGGEKRVDAVVVVTTSPEVQRERILGRGTMTPETLDSILARQMPDAEKRKRADFVVDTSHGLDPARAAIRDILEQVAKMPRRRP